MQCEWVNGNKIVCKALSVVTKTKKAPYKYTAFTIYSSSIDLLGSMARGRYTGCHFSSLNEVLDYFNLNSLCYLLFLSKSKTLISIWSELYSRSLCVPSKIVELMCRCVNNSFKGIVVGEVFESTKHFWSLRGKQPNPIQLKSIAISSSDIKHFRTVAWYHRSCLEACCVFSIVLLRLK